MPDPFRGPWLMAVLVDRLTFTPSHSIETAGESYRLGTTRAAKTKARKAG